MSKVGDTLKANVTPAGVKIATYRWMADGVEVGTDATLAVTDEMVGKKITVKVTGEDKTTATSEATAAVAEVTATLEKAVQTTANKVKLTFAPDASKVVKEDITVSTADGTLAIPVNAIEVNGAVAEITLTQALKDATTYTVTYKDSTVDFEASIGAVASVEITTDTAEMNKATPIEFILRDDNGVDVTSTVSLTNVEVTVDGDYASADLGNAKNATITMDTVDAVATVTVTYSKADGKSDEISSSKDITCVPASATVGAKLFFQGTDNSNNVNAESHCAKFYAGLSSTVATAVEGNDGAPIWFCATDDNGDAISYDSYEVESSNDDVFSVDTDTYDTGKFVKLVIAGNQEGTGYINISASKNDVVTPYTIPVKIVPESKGSKIALSASLPTMSNAWDTDYVGYIKATMTDKDGNKVAPSDGWAVEITSGNEGKIADDLNGIDQYGTSTSGAGDPTMGFHVTGIALTPADNDKNIASYTAACAKKGTYTIKVSGTVDGTVYTKSISVNVKELPKAAWPGIGDGTGVKAEYTVAVGDIDEKKSAANAKTTARLAVTMSGLFAGYVNDAGTGSVGDVTIGDAQTTVSGNGMVATAATTIQSTTGVKAAAKYGSKIATGLLTNLTTAAPESQAVAGLAALENEGSDGENDGIVYRAKNDADTNGSFLLDVSDRSNDSEYARTGTWTALFRYKLGVSTSYTTVTNTFKVTNTLYIPTVEVLNRNVDAFAVNPDFQSAVGVSVDFNNNDAVGASLDDILDKDGASLVGASSPAVSKYYVVHENYEGEVTTFLITKVTTFKEN